MQKAVQPVLWDAPPFSAAGYNLPYAVYKELHSKAPRCPRQAEILKEAHGRLQPTCVEAQPAPVLGFGFGESLGPGTSLLVIVHRFPWRETVEVKPPGISTSATDQSYLSFNCSQV